MAATFRTRPCQLAPSLARPALVHNIPTNPAVQAHVMRQISCNPKTRTRGPLERLSPGMLTSMRRTRKSIDDQQATSSLHSEMMAEQKTSPALAVSESAILAPRTIVTIPFRKLAANRFERIFKYYYEVVKQRFLDRLQIFMQTWKLKPKTFSRATFKMSRAGVVNEALKLHADMSRALAEGGKQGKEHLDRVCIPKLSRSLVAAIEARPKGRSYRWERVKLTGSPFWPRLVDHKWTEADVGWAMSFRQAVVGIKSVQRLTELQDGKLVGEKEQEVMEYVVLWASVDKIGKHQAPWHIFGTLKETTYQALRHESEMMKQVSALMAKDDMNER